MGPFQVSSSGKSVQTATGPDQLLTLNKPMSKLDVTNIISFQTLSILFNHEPPQPPSSPGYADVQLAQFAHGYTYIPSIWMTWQNHSPAYPGPPPVSGTATTFYDFGDETAAANIPGVGNATVLSLYAVVQYNDGGLIRNNTDAFFYVVVDATNVTLYLRKAVLESTLSGSIVPIFIIGTSVDMRLYVFAEPATTSTY